MNVIQFPSRWEPLLSKRQLATLWGCSTKTIDRRVTEGLPSIPPEHSPVGRRMFRLSDVEAWLERRAS